MISKEFLFKECNLQNHCIALHLKKPLTTNQGKADVVYLKAIVMDEQQVKETMENINRGADTSGVIKIEVFTESTNPFETQIVSLSTDDIESYEERK